MTETIARIEKPASKRPRKLTPAERELVQLLARAAVRRWRERRSAAPASRAA